MTFYQYDQDDGAPLRYAARHNDVHNIEFLMKQHAYRAQIDLKDKVSDRSWNLLRFMHG